MKTPSTFSRGEIVAVISRFVNEQARIEDRPSVQVEPNQPILNGALGIDSLGLAALLVELELHTGHDPFANGIVNFRTVGELADLYIQG